MLLIIVAVPQNTVRTYGFIRYFDVWKAFGYIERVVKSDFIFGKDLFYFICALNVLSYHLVYSPCKDPESPLKERVFILIRNR